MPWKSERATINMFLYNALSLLHALIKDIEILVI